MKITLLTLSLLTLHTATLRAELEPLTNGQAYLAATLAALSTPKMKEAPIQVNAAISKAAGLQEDAGAKAIVAIPDEGLEGQSLAKLSPGQLPLCRLWMKGCALKLPLKSTAKVEQKDVDAEGEKHSVTIWLLGVRLSAKGKPELMVCSNQKEPVMVKPLEAVSPPLAADPDAPVQISVETGEGNAQLVLTLMGGHKVRLDLEQ